jgi:hypothetical protein
MTTTSGYSGQLGERLSRYVPDRGRNEWILDYRGAQRRIESGTAAAAAAAAGDLNETGDDDERQKAYDVHLAPVMG